MDSNDMYQNQQTAGTEPGGNAQGNFSADGYQNNNSYHQNDSQNYNQNPYIHYNGNYQAPYQQPQVDLEEPVKMSEWLISFLIMIIPCVGIIMIFVWAFGSTEKKSKSNFFKAQLIMCAIVIVLWILAVILLAALGITMSSLY